MKKLLILVLTGLFVSVALTTAYAVPIAPGGSAPSAGAASPGGSLITSITVPFTGALGYVSGTLVENVRINNTGTLFEYIVTSTGTAITSFTASIYDSFTTSLDGPILPHIPHVDSLARSADGNTVDFTYTDDWVATGQNTGTLWVQTNARWYERGIFTAQGTDTATIRALGPSSVPEPGSMMLLGMGLIGLVGGLRKKFMA